MLAFVTISLHTNLDEFLLKMVLFLLSFSIVDYDLYILSGLLRSLEMRVWE